jgi:cytochrome c oxidase subunit 3
MHEPSVAPQFTDLQQQEEVAQLGMWIFLSTEVLFFGGLFLLYYAYRFGYTAAFSEAARHTNIVIGTINTVVLLTSSFAVAWALAAVAVSGRFAALLLGLAALLGVIFLGLKSVEYIDDYRDGLVPALHFTFSGPQSGGVELFFIFYFIATGLHVVHLTVGIALLSSMAVRAQRAEFTEHYRAPLTVSALYWHFVDAVWIFLFALIYLPGRNGA